MKIKETENCIGFENAWLSYKPQTDCKDAQYFTAVYAACTDPLICTAVSELQTASKQILNQNAVLHREAPASGAVGIWLKLGAAETVSKEGYHLYEKEGLLVIASAGAQGILLRRTPIRRRLPAWVT